MSWDKDANSAWTDFSGYTSCLKDAVPDFISNAFSTSSGGSQDEALVDLSRRLSDEYGGATSMQFTRAGQPRRGGRGNRGRGLGTGRGSGVGLRASATGRCSGAHGAGAGTGNGTDVGNAGRRRLRGSHVPVSALVVLLVPLALAGCSADWDGSKALEREGYALPTNVEPSSWATLDGVQVTRAESDGVALLGISGALEPDHAIALCEEAQAVNPGARISVTDAEGFPLALAEPAGKCEYDPILLEGLVIDEE